MYYVEIRSNISKLTVQIWDKHAKSVKSIKVYRARIEFVDNIRHQNTPMIPAIRRTNIKPRNERRKEISADYDKCYIKQNKNVK